MKKLISIILCLIAISVNAQDTVSYIDSLELFTNEVLITDSSAWWNTYTLFNVDEEKPVPFDYIEFDVKSKHRENLNDKIAIIINNVIYDSYEADSIIMIMDTTYINNIFDHVDTITYDSIIDVPLIHEGYNKICFGNLNRNICPYFSDINYAYNIEIFSYNEQNYDSDSVYIISDITLVKDNSKKKIKKFKQIFLPFIK